MKEKVSTEKYKQEWESLKKMYKNYHIIYTNGFSGTRGTGSSFLCNEMQCSWTLVEQASARTAEAWAVAQALNFCPYGGHDSYLVATSALDLILEIDKASYKNPLAITILDKLSYLQSESISVVFVWVPAHVGIVANEKAHEIARKAAYQCNPDTEILARNDLKVYARNYIQRQWLNAWNDNNNWLSAIKRDIKVWQPQIKLNRQDRTKIERLRLGHTRVTHSHLLRGEPVATCNRCGEVLTIRHMLIECEAYNNARLMYNISEYIPEMLNSANNIENLLIFLKATDLYKDI